MEEFLKALLYLVLFNLEHQRGKSETHVRFNSFQYCLPMMMWWMLRAINSSIWPAWDAKQCGLLILLIISYFYPLHQYVFLLFFDHFVSTNFHFWMMSIPNFLGTVYKMRWLVISFHPDRGETHKRLDPCLNQK